MLLPCGPQILRGGQGPSSVRGNEGLNSQAIEGAIKPSFFIWPQEYHARMAKAGIEAPFSGLGVCREGYPTGRFYCHE